MEKILFFLLLFPVLSVCAQNRISVSGRILGSDENLNNIHVYNKNTSKGAITNNLGDFRLQVAVNDVLIISSIQFSVVKYIVTEADFFSKQLNIHLKKATVLLDEVIVKSHQLQGSLFFDKDKVPQDFEKYLHYKLSFKGINFNAPGKITSPTDYKLPDPLRTSETVNSIDFVGVFKKLTSGIRQKKKRKKQYQRVLEELPFKIRKELRDAFFVNELKIPKPLIEDFLNICQQ